MYLHRSVAMLLCLMAASGVYAQTPENDTQPRPEESLNYRQLLRRADENDRQMGREAEDFGRRVQAIAKEDDVEQRDRLLDEIVEEIERRWLAEDPRRYAQLMLVVVDNLTWKSYVDHDQYRATVEKHAIETLEKADPIRHDVEFKLLRYLRHEPKGNGEQDPDGDSFEQERRRRAIRWLTAWKRLEQAADPTWDPIKDAPAINLTPPAATKLRSGVSPGAIKDPELRAEYEAALINNMKKIERSKTQQMILDLKKRYPSHLEQFILTAYSRPPRKIDEIVKLLDDFIGDEDLKGRIVTSLRAISVSNKLDL